MFHDLLTSRRSIRKYLDKPVEKEKLDTIMQCALLSPSSRAIRPWTFIAVTDRDTLDALSRCRRHSTAFLAAAPLGIVVLAEPECSDVWIEDAAIASVIIQLAAQSLDLGSCWVQVRKRLHGDQKTAEAYIKELLNVPEQYTVESIIAIGYPNETKHPYAQQDLPQDKVHFETL